MDARAHLQELYRQKPALLAPLEDVSDDVFRRVCRARGATICVTEFVNVEGLLRGCRNAKRKIRLSPDDQLTAIQIYGSDPERLEEAAQVAAEANPLFLGKTLKQACAIDPHAAGEYLLGSSAEPHLPPQSIGRPLHRQEWESDEWTALFGIIRTRSSSNNDGSACH